MKISRHAASRTRDRAGKIDPRMLWEAGRSATDTDLASFPCYRYPNREYRITIWQGHVFLLSRGTQCNELITVIRRDG